MDPKRWSQTDSIPVILFQSEIRSFGIGKEQVLIIKLEPKWKYMAKACAGRAPDKT